MKFLKSEGRILCLVEKDDIHYFEQANLPKIDLMIIPRHYQQEIEKSHLWDRLIKSVGNNLHKVIFW